MRPPAPACSPRGAQLPAAWPLRFLRLHQDVAHLQVPLLPLVAAVVVHDLRAVVPVVDVRARCSLGQVVLGEPLDAADEPRPVLRPAQIHPAEQGLGGHHGRRAAAGLIRVERAAVVLHAVEIESRPCPRFRRARSGSRRGPIAAP